MSHDERCWGHKGSYLPFIKKKCIERIDNLRYWKGKLSNDANLDN